MINKRNILDLMRSYKNCAFLIITQTVKTSRVQLLRHICVLNNHHFFIYILKKVVS
jgi:hypothetical protein